MIRIARGIFWTIVILALIAWPLSLIFAADRPTASPAATAGDWLTDPDNALAQVVALAQVLCREVGSWGLGTKLLALVGIAVAVIRCTPAWGPIAGVAWDWFMATRKDKALEQELATQADGFKVLVRNIESLRPGSTLADLRDRLGRKMPETVKRAVDSYLDRDGRALFAGVDRIEVVSDRPAVVPPVSSAGG